MRRFISKPDHQAGLVFKLRHLAPAFERAAQGEFIGELQSAPGRQAVGDTGNFQPGTRQPLGEIMTRGVALNIGAEGDDNFVNRLAC